MLKSVDIALSVAVVMLLVSMAVTVLTQAFTNLFNSRARHLRDGLAALLGQLHPEALTVARAQEIAGRLLGHPLIQESGGRMGSLIHRHEFTRLLLELATQETPRPLSSAALAYLQETLKVNGVADPEKTLASIRNVALELELSHPAIAAGMRQELAILQGAASDLVGKINSWFDQTIDRVSARFTLSVRWITFGCGLAVAFTVQLDTVQLINRLSTDDALRGALVRQAIANPQDSPEFHLTSLEKINHLTSNDLFDLPCSPADWLTKWRLAKLPGILLSTLLLSLGAPFWFEALKNLLRLRSLIAVKDDEQRRQRQAPTDMPAR